MKLTPAQSRALGYIGRNNRKGANIGPKLSVYMFNKLKLLGLVLEYEDIILLTAEGERQFAQMRRKKS